MLKDTIIAIIFVGFPATFRGIRARATRGIFKRIVLPEIGLSAILQTYLDLETFSLPIEIALQLLLSLLILVPIANKDDRGGVNHLFNELSGIIGICIIVCSTISFAQNYLQIDWADQARTLLMTIWYPLLLVPVSYLMALYDATVISRKRYRTFLKSESLVRYAILFLIPSIRGCAGFQESCSIEQKKCGLVTYNFLRTLTAE